jgi:xanthine dehydrogenase accessory factor
MFDEFFQTAHELTKAGRPFATAVVVRAERPTSGKPGDRALVTADGVMHGWIGGSCAQPTVVREALAALEDNRSRLIRLSPDPGAGALPEGMVEVPMTCFSGGTLDIFIEPHQPRPQLLLVGSLPVAQALAHLGRALSYGVTAVDPERGDAMAHADQVVQDLGDIPDLVTPLTFVVVATHGDYDEPALAEVLATGAPYVGLVASRKRGDAVMEALRLDGVAEDDITRVKFPAGLDIGATRGDEIALSIMAEIVQVRRGLEAVEWSEGTERDSPDVTVRPTATQAAGAAAMGAGPPPPQAQDVETALDPICKMTVRVEDALHTHEHEGRTYYFCCGGCRASFIADPEEYLLPRA